MKKYIFLTITAAALLMAITGCQHVPLAPTPQQQILGKWYMTDAIANTVYTASYMQINNSKDTTAFTHADYFNFKADSTVEIMENGNAHPGKWKMVNNVVIFTGTNYMDIPGTGWSFPTLTTTKLRFYHTEQDPAANTEFILDLSR